jgi:hypothetical protein
MNTMFLRHIFMAGLATACGIAVSAGTFAFLLVIGVIPRMIKRCNFGERILMVENTVILGVLTGAVFSVMEWKAQLPYPWLAHVILGAYGTAAGIFVGCTAETIEIPKTLVGWLDGRSTLARFGLLVHVTAHRVDPGWNGKVVLEFYNAGAWPLRLQPGMKIGAMSFEEINGRIDVGYGDRADASYQNQQSVVLPGGGK